jgi:polyisoprenoid-binding protein YceI
MGHRIGYAAQTKINRKEFGMNFDAVLDGRFVVSNEIQINIEGEIVEAAGEAAQDRDAQEAGKAR